MKPPVIQRFQKENYPDSPDWFARFLDDLNLFSEVSWNIFNKNISLNDNLDMQLYTFSLKAGAAANNNTISFPSTLKHTPLGLFIVNCVNTAAYATPPTTAVHAFWSYSAPTISITAITGLTNTTNYSLSVMVI